MLPTPPSPMEGFDPDTVLSKLTTAEKINLLSGIPNNESFTIPYISSPRKESIFGIQNLSLGLECRQFDSQMAPMASAVLDFSTALVLLASHAVLL
jgi:hypothetical protein